MDEQRYAQLAPVVENGHRDDILAAITEIAQDPADSVRYLAELLKFKASGLGKQLVPRLVARALIGKGAEGVQVLTAAVFEAPGRIYPAAAFQELWFASMQRHLPPLLHTEDELAQELKPPIDPDTAKAAADAVHDLIVESRNSTDLFDTIIHFIHQATMMPEEEQLAFQRHIFDAFTEATIRLTKPLIAEFETMIAAELREEEYQAFLKENPVLLDPLATKVIAKQRLGTEFATDFAIGRLDNEWTLVEIEKPQDALFTQSNDFRAELTHALGQVIDFLEWVGQEPQYAGRHMSGIREPTGLLVMGRRTALTNHQVSKLTQLKRNLLRIKIATYDDLVESAKWYYRNMRPQPATT